MKVKEGEENGSNQNQGINGFFLPMPFLFGGKLRAKII